MHEGYGNIIAMAYVGLAHHMCTPRGYLASLHVNGKGQGKPLPPSASLCMTQSIATYGTKCADS
jgi:hypothetical protein